MDDSRTQPPTGHVESTPEAEPLDLVPTSPPAQTPTGGASDQPSAGPSTPSAAAGSSGSEDRAGEVGRDLAKRLKPVAAAAESAAVTAINLSSKGLSRLAAMLEERRRRRGSGDR